MNKPTNIAAKAYAEAVADAKLASRPEGISRYGYTVRLDRTTNVNGMVIYSVVDDETGKGIAEGTDWTPVQALHAADCEAAAADSASV